MKPNIIFYGLIKPTYLSPRPTMGGAAAKTIRERPFSMAGTQAILFILSKLNIIVQITLQLT